MYYPESCNGLDDDCDASTDEGGDALCADLLWCNGAETCGGVSGCLAGTAPDCADSVTCTVDSCNEGTDSCDHAENNAYCDNGLWCDGAETCNAVSGCQAGTTVDCAANDIAPVATCSYIPDAFNLTWDYFAGFVSTCNEATDSCNVYGGSSPWTLDITHACDATCGAECVVDDDCGSGSYCDACACRMKGDVNGDDNVDVLDLTLAAAAFGSFPGYPNWDPDADVWPAGGDGTVNESDLEYIDNYYGSKIGEPVCQGGTDDLIVQVTSSPYAPGKVSLGGTVPVEVDIETAVGIYSGEVRLSYNASVLNLTYINEGNFLKMDGNATFNITRTNATAGTVMFASSRMGSVPEVAGSGSVVMFTFSAIGKGVSGLNIYDSLLLAKNLTEVEAGVINGTIEVVNLTGDANKDCKVGLVDLATVALAYDSVPGNSTWNPLADFNGDSRISIADLAAVGLHYDEKC